MTTDGVPPVRFTVRLPQTFCVADPESIAASADAAEDLGFLGVSVKDHLIPARPADADIWWLRRGATRPDIGN